MNVTASPAAAAEAAYDTHALVAVLARAVRLTLAARSTPCIPSGAYHRAWLEAGDALLLAGDFLAAAPREVVEPDADSLPTLDEIAEAVCR